MNKHGSNYAMKAFVPGKEESEFNVEAAILSKLDHPGIPRFVEVFSCNNVDYLVQEFVEGYPLSYHIVNGRRFSKEEVGGILSQLLGILIYLHEPEKGRLPVVHRDLRLSNVFWFNDTLRLIDFGFARYLNEETGHTDRQAGGTDLTMSRHRPGNKTYSMLREEVSPRSDLFGAGVVALDLFTNWIKDEQLFQEPWQGIFPGGDLLKAFIGKLLIPEEQFLSARDALNYLGRI